MSTGEAVPTLTPAGELNRFEWIAREAIWGTLKAPMPFQWERYRQHPDPRDPGGNFGIVIDGNLTRTHQDMAEAARLEVTHPDRAELLSRAATHLGKLAAGLVAISAHLRTPSGEWELPIEHHVPTILDTTRTVLTGYGLSGARPTFDPRQYYDRINGVNDVIQSHLDHPDNVFVRSSGLLVGEAGTVAAKTWDTFLDANPRLAMVPGGTPRSGPDEIAEAYELLAPFEDAIRAAAD